VEKAADINMGREKEEETEPDSMSRRCAAYPEAQRAVAGVGGGRSSPESKKLAAGPERGTAKTAEIEGTLRRFLARGEQGEGGASLGALGLERGGRNRRGAGELLTVVFSQIRKGGRGWWRR
jgi:hypothetical protein